MPLRLVLIIASAVASAAIAGETPAFEATLQRLVGKSLSVVVDRIGKPQAEHLLGSVVEYSWGMGYEALVVVADGPPVAQPKNPYSSCELTLDVDVRSR